MTSLRAYLVLLTAVALERLFELWLSRHNAGRLRARGARVLSTDAYGPMVLLHLLFLPACAFEAIGFHRPFPDAIGYLCLVAVLGAQAVRYWAILALGERWCTRVVVLPAALPVTHGPYRFVRHPNYLAVIVEMACLPLLHGGYFTAVVFSAANAVLLARRIRVEEQALGGTYARAFADRPRLLPRSH